MEERRQNLETPLLAWLNSPNKNAAPFDVNDVGHMYNEEINEASSSSTEAALLTVTEAEELRLPEATGKTEGGGIVQRGGEKSIRDSSNDGPGASAPPKAKRAPTVTIGDLRFVLVCGQWIWPPILFSGTTAVRGPEVHQWGFAMMGNMLLLAVLWLIASPAPRTRNDGGRPPQRPWPLGRYEILPTVVWGTVPPLSILLSIFVSDCPEVFGALLILLALPLLLLSALTIRQNGCRAVCELLLSFGNAALRRITAVSEQFVSFKHLEEEHFDKLRECEEQESRRLAAQQERLAYLEEKRSKRVMGGKARVYGSFLMCLFWALGSILFAITGISRYPSWSSITKEYIPQLAVRREGNGFMHMEGIAPALRGKGNFPVRADLFPPMPPHVRAVDLFGEKIVKDTLLRDKPTVAGIIGVLQRFLDNLHRMLMENKHAETPDEVVGKYFDLVTEYLAPLERAYRDRSIFPIREDGSTFISLGAYRDHMLGETLRQAFKSAAYPEKLFVGAVVQNCFGIDVQCHTSSKVIGMDEHGRPLTEESDQPPDVNGIEQFCSDPDYGQYCESGQIRALYVNETESNGPPTGRYFASKLWGGETYFLQADSHLRFAQDWDKLYAEEVKLAKAYPKAVLSSNPPPFAEEDPPYMGGSKGTRLCTCAFSDSGVEHRMLKINTGNMCYYKEETAPSQIAYIAAGFFFARAEFLVDVPFDPYLPWCFMGEEIALSLRAWTHGWDIYAPRKNLIAHQYRPLRMGLPKLWENTARVFGRPGSSFFIQLQTITINRIKYMAGYKEQTAEWLEGKNWQMVLTDFEHYGPGDIRTTAEFLEDRKIDMDHERCGHIHWCNDCTLL